MRTCIKCGIEKDEREFRDYWYARTNICKACKSAYLKEYYQLKRQRIKRCEVTK